MNTEKVIFAQRLKRENQYISNSNFRMLQKFLYKIILNLSFSVENRGEREERGFLQNLFKLKENKNITRIGQACKSGQQTAICQPQATSYRHLRNKSIPKHSVILENNIHAHFHFPIFLPFNKKSLLEGKRNL